MGCMCAGRIDEELENSINPDSARSDLRARHYSTGNDFRLMCTGRIDAELEWREDCDMDNNMKIVEMKCPGCGSTLRIPPDGTRFVRCDYCGGTYAVNWNQGMQRPAPNWRPAPPPVQQNNSKEDALGLRITLGIFAVIFLIAGGIWISVHRKSEEEAELAGRAESLDIDIDDIAGTGGRVEEDAEAGTEFTGLLGEMISVAFGKDADSVTPQELSQIKWIADKSDFDYIYIGYSFEDPLENPDAEIEWLVYSDDIDIRYENGYEGLSALKGLKKLETRKSLAECNLKGLKLESLSASIYSLEDAAAAVDDPSLIRELGIDSSIESMQGLELFPNVEKLSIYASSLSDISEVTTMPKLKSLTLENADQLNDFAVFASIENLEELIIESENIKALNFVSRMPKLKSLGIADGELLDLDGVETLADLEKLSVTDCGELKNMKAVEGLTGLKELTLEKPYDCEEPSLGALTGLTKLTLESFSSCSFLQNMTELTTLTLNGCDLPENIDLSGLTKLKRLTCTTAYTDRSLQFIGGISSLESVNLRGMVTYEDISGIFALPAVKEINISGIECEIDFDKVSENTSLETLKMSGVTLYENVKVSGGGGIIYVDWDDVFLADHLDFFRSFPNLKRLDISENEIKELSFAESLGKLEEIDFSDNYVSELRPLAAIPSLKLVNCTGNPIMNFQALDDSVMIIYN